MSRSPLKKDGSVAGDLTMAQIVIEDGAYFKGTNEINKSAEKESGKDVYPPADSWRTRQR